MKTDQRVRSILLVSLMCLIGLTVCSKTYFDKANVLSKESMMSENYSRIDLEKTLSENTPKIVYDGLTFEELSDKLNRSLNSTISGYGEMFASKSLELGLDPYLAVAIVLHETGCSWECSDLVNQCYNVGGQKGDPGCWGGSYQAFDSMEDGINSYLENLYYNYYALGLTTPETIGPSYAASETWADRINYYIERIRAT